jgi:hypothetical protein
MFEHKIIKYRNIKVVFFLFLAVIYSMCIPGCSGPQGWSSEIGWFDCNYWFWEDEFGSDDCAFKDKDNEDDYEDTPEPVTPPDQKKIPVEFSSTTNTAFGFDDFYDLSDVENEFLKAKNVYVSLATGGTTVIKVRVMNTNYSSYWMKTVPAGVISAVTTIGGVTGQKIQTTVANEVTLTSLGTDAGNVKLIIYGLNSANKETDLSGTDECDNILNVEIYQEKVIRKYNIVNASSCSYTSNYLQTLHNIPLKQAVIKFDNDFVATPLLDKSWDLNGNGVLDMFVGTTPVGCISEDAYLFVLVADALKIESDKIFENSMTIILPGGQIREHCYLTQDVPVGSKSIYVHEIDGLDKNLQVGARIEIANWLTERDPAKEYFYIAEIDIENKKITFTNPTTKPHSKGESFYYSSTLGFTYKNVSIVYCGAPQCTYAHELLHQNRFGGLDHFTNGLDDSHEYKSNLMYWAVNPASISLLCGRGLICEKSNARIKQWLTINNSPALSLK